MSEYTVSMSVGKTAPKHTQRDVAYVAKEQAQGRLQNVDISRTKDNIILKRCDNLEREFNELFESEVEEFNEKKRKSGHPERQINNYFEHIQNLKPNKYGAKMKTNYEYVIQFGGRETDYPVNSVELLKSVYAEFEKLNDQFHINYAAIHVDEETPHLHINLTPVARGYNRGVAAQPGLNKATVQLMEQLKNESLSREFAYTNLLEYTKFDVMTKLVEQQGDIVVHRNKTVAHSTVEEFKEKKRLELNNELLLQENKNQRSKLDYYEHENLNLNNAIEEKIYDINNLRLEAEGLCWQNEKLSSENSRLHNLNEKLKSQNEQIRQDKIVLQKRNLKLHNDNNILKRNYVNLRKKLVKFIEDFNDIAARQSPIMEQARELWDKAAGSINSIRNMLIDTYNDVGINNQLHKQYKQSLARRPEIVWKKEQVVSPTIEAEPRVPAPRQRGDYER